MYKFGHGHSFLVIFWYEANTCAEEVGIWNRGSVANFASEIKRGAIHTGNVNDALCARDEFKTGSNLDSTQSNVGNDNVCRPLTAIDRHRCVIEEFIANVPSFIRVVCQIQLLHLPSKDNRNYLELSVSYFHMLRENNLAKIRGGFTLRQTLLDSQGN